MVVGGGGKLGRKNTVSEQHLVDETNRKRTITSLKGAGKGRKS